MNPELKALLEKFDLKGDQLKEVSAVVKRIDDKAGQKAASLKAERDNLKAQLANRDSDIEDLKKAAKGNEGLTAKLAALKKSYKDDTDALNEKLDAVKLEHAITDALVKANARNPKAVLELRAFA